MYFSVCHRPLSCPVNSCPKQLLDNMFSYRPSSASLQPTSNSISLHGVIWEVSGKTYETERLIVKWIQM